ncbi:DNA/RNA-binding protein [Alicyclobacillus contaminans]|uniref:RNA-binding cell elongation regulator Jag/EloR n=1 Tax=Alicyclobacillus contaminans TaxID=392016 RepID=UPI000402E2EF|nr:RNA-binding cell elongation regulator Jag/EloR [Alicyclobacillus contaminans]GMA50746.1 DNA/RNA-binding protein [Alicyclobacillus contaminans]
MKKVIATGRTIDDAVTSALVKLGVTRSQASVRVIREPVRGWFGILGARDAEVEVSVQLAPEDALREFLGGTLRRMGVEARIRTRVIEEEGRKRLHADVVCEEEDLPIVIGRHGTTLESLQYLANVVVNQGQDRFVKVVVDAGDYRRRRQEGLQRMADRAAVRAVRTKRPVVMDPMPAADRKFIHTYLQERSDVTTSSEGAEPHRKVVVVPVVQSGPPKSVSIP